MSFMKVVILLMVVTQILGTSVKNPKDTAAKLKSDFDHFTKTTRTSLDNKLDATITNITSIYNNSDNPYNPIVDTINSFITDIYGQLKTYVSNVRGIQTVAVKLITTESGSFINSNLTVILNDINTGAAEVNKVLDNFAYDVTAKLLKAFKKFTKTLKHANYGHTTVPIGKLLAEIRLIGDDIFKSEEGLIVGNKSNGLIYVDNSIASLKLPAPSTSCSWFHCITRWFHRFF